MQALGFPSLLVAAREAVGNTIDKFVLHGQMSAIVVVDATCGNGNDTLFMARRLREHCPASAKDYAVISIDVQPQALESAAALLHSHNCMQGVSFVLSGHEHISSILQERYAKQQGSAHSESALAVVMYNLGFLPRSDKKVVTCKENTLLSLENCRSLLAPGGLIAVHAYGGHAGGSEERDAVASWCSALPFDDWVVAHYAIANKTRNPESLFLAQKRQDCRRDP